MTLLEFVAAYCPDGPAQLRRLILERTGIAIPYGYLWKWTDPRKPCAVSVENAAVLHAATQGKCSLNELLSLKTIRTRKVPARKPKPKRAAEPKAKRKRAAAPKTSALQKRIAELEAQLAERASA